MMTGDYISRSNLKEWITFEYNRHRTGDGLKLAWIEKAIDEAGTGWMPLSIRPPEIEWSRSGCVKVGDLWPCLVTVKLINTSYLLVAAFDGEKFLSPDYDILNDVVAWMPWPEPYEEG